MTRARVAIAHDYLTQRGGAERVVLAIARAFPGARIHTSVYEPDGTYPEFADLDVVTTLFKRAEVWAERHPGQDASTFLSELDAEVLPSDSVAPHGSRPGGVAVLTPAGAVGDVVAVDLRDPARPVLRMGLAAQNTLRRAAGLPELDAEGNLICITQSLGSPFGSGVVVPGTGLCFNNSLYWADVQPGSPNRSKPGDELPMCMSPTLSTRAHVGWGSPAASSSARSTSGTGLGLAIVKHIVNRHRGRLIIDSKRGQGSSFTVLLPEM